MEVTVKMYPEEYDLFRECTFERLEEVAAE